MCEEAGWGGGGGATELWSPGQTRVFALKTFNSGETNAPLPLPGFSEGSSDIYGWKWNKSVSPALTLTFDLWPLITFQGKLFAFLRCFAGFITLREKKTKQ